MQPICIQLEWVGQRVLHPGGERVLRAVGGRDTERDRAAHSLALRAHRRHDGDAQLVDRLPQPQPPQQLRTVEWHTGHRHSIQTNCERTQCLYALSLCVCEH